MKKCRIYEDGTFNEIGLGADKINFDKRMVAFLDVLGFKAKLETLNQVEIAKIYRQLLGVVNDMNSRLSESGGNSCQLFVFSDSIILIAKGDSDKDVAEFIGAVWRFLQSSIVIGMPFRGGISYGDVYINEGEKVFLGNPIVRAVQLEGQQEWIGISCDYYAAKRIDTIELDGDWEKIIPNILLIDYDVPLKNGEKERRKVVNWRLNLIVEAGVATLFKNETDRADVEIKNRNTLEFAKYVRSTRKLYIKGNDNEMIKKKCSICYVGETQPPFKNGDEY